MCLMTVRLAEVFVVQLHDSRVLLRLADIAVAVILVKHCGAKSAQINVISDRCGLIGLSAAVDASAGARHDLDELNIELARLNVVKERLGVLCAGGNGNIDGDVSDLVGSGAVG